MELYKIGFWEENVNAHMARVQKLWLLKEAKTKSSKYCIYEEFVGTGAPRKLKTNFSTDISQQCV